MDASTVMRLLFFDLRFALIFVLLLWFVIFYAFGSGSGLVLIFMSFRFFVFAPALGVVLPKLGKLDVGYSIFVR